MGPESDVEELLQEIVTLFGKGLQDRGSTCCFHAS